MNNKRTPILGETLFSLNVGNAARRTPQELTPVKVVKIGHRYFTCATEDKYKNETIYLLDSWREKTDYSPISQLYDTREEWQDQVEATKIKSELREVFGSLCDKNVPIDSLRKIREILIESGNIKADK